MGGFWQRLFGRRQINHKINPDTPIQEVLPLLSKTPYPEQLSVAVPMIKEILGNSSDLVIRQIRVSGKTLAIAYIEDLADKKLVKVVLESLLLKRPLVEQAGLNLDANMERWREMGVPLGEVTAVQNMGEAITGLLNGNTCLMGDGWPQALLVDTKGWEKRAISEPQTSIVVRGSREGFVENIRTNMALVRRRLRHPNLRVESLVVGDVTNTQISIMYVDGIVNSKLVAEVRERIRRIKIDGVLEGHYLEAMIEDNPFSPFPQVWSTERPDTVVADLLEGRVAILTDGTPFALTAPLQFATLLQSPEDYYQRWTLSLFLRTFRYLGLGISAFLPALYVAVTTYHQEMLPTPLLISILMQRERVPYPAVVEALVMQITFEILLEAGARLPRALGQAIGIVGALVIGDAAVRAGLVSPAMVIVISATAIASFTFPSFDLTNTVRLLRVPLILMGAVLGLFGLFSGLILIMIHLVNLRSFGIPYLQGMAPFSLSDQKDYLIRAPWWMMRRRPELVGKENIVRQAPDQGPKPPGDERGRGPNSISGPKNKEQDNRQAPPTTDQGQRRRSKRERNRQGGEQGK